MKFKLLPVDKINSLPKSPGVYTFKKGAKLLYIGKAGNIRDRVRAHFQKAGFKESIFLQKTKKIGFIKTNSEIDALILEANLIKKYQPKYNVLWKDDKNYFFVGITKEDFPRVFWTHQTSLKTKNYQLKTEFVGPFVDGKALKQTLRVLRKVFPYRSCKKIPKRPCLWYQLGRCPAPCLLRAGVSKQIPSFSKKMKLECQQNVKNLLKILKGRKKKVLQNLKKEMKKASLLTDFERAAKIRDRILALKKILAHEKIFDRILTLSSPLWKDVEKKLKKLLKTEEKINRIEAYDISNIQGQQATGSMITFVNGKPEKKFYRLFKIKISKKPNDIAMIKEVLKRRFRHPEWGFPDLILIDGGKAHLNAAIQCLKSGLKQIKVVGLAKKKNELYVQSIKNPVRLDLLPNSLKFLILQLRDEAHRFARKYHLKLRKKKLFENNF